MYRYCNIKIESTPGSVPLFSFYAYQSFQSATNTEPGSGSAADFLLLNENHSLLISLHGCSAGWIAAALTTQSKLSTVATANYDSVNAGLTRPVCDQTVSALSLHLDVCAAATLQRQNMGSVGGLILLLPETSTLK